MKKIICLVLVMLFLFPAGTFADDEIPIRVQLNGSYLTFDVQPAIIDGRTMVPFKTIAESIGATVSYDGENRQVIATKNDRTIVFTIDSPAVLIKGKYGEYTYYMDTPAVIVSDRTLIPLRFLSEACGLEVGWDAHENTAVLIDYSYFVNRIKQEATNFYKALGLIKVTNNVHNSIAQNFDVTADSKTFGVNIHAGNSINADIKQDGEKVSADVNIQNSGLYNLYTFFMQTDTFGINEPDKYITPDFVQPMNIKFMLNDDFSYTKSDIISGLLLDNYSYSYLDSEYIEGLKSKWLKFPTDENKKDEFFGYDQLSADQKVTNMINGLVPRFDSYYFDKYYYDSFVFFDFYDYLNGFSYNPNLKNSIEYFKSIDTMVTILCGFLGNDKLILTENEDGSSQITYTLNEKMANDLIMKVVNAVQDETIKTNLTNQVKQYFDILHFSISTDLAVKDGLVLKSALDANSHIDNIPNLYNMQIGTIDAKLTFKTESSDIGKVTLTDSDFPTENVVDQEQLEKDNLQAKIKYYTDRGYTVDENGNIDYGSYDPTFDEYGG